MSEEVKVKIWTWKDLEELVLKTPWALEIEQKLSHGDDCSHYATFDDWYNANCKRATYTVKLIDCNQIDSLIFQDEELMNLRRLVSQTPKEFKELKGNEFAKKYSQCVQNILDRYARDKKCHRVFDGSQAGVHCYCDES